MSLPDIDFGAAVGSGVGFMRTILGYAPIEPDGSVSVRVPANVPFTLSILDKDGRRLPQFGRHTSWLQLRPGEERHCSGCHEAPVGTATERSHGRDGTSVPAWAGTTAGLLFAGTMTPISLVPQTGDHHGAGARARHLRQWHGLLGNTAREPAGRGFLEHRADCASNGSGHIGRPALWRRRLRRWKRLVHPSHRRTGEHRLPAQLEQHLPHSHQL